MATSIGTFPSLRVVGGWLGQIPDSRRGLAVLDHPELETMGGFPSLETIPAGGLQVRNNASLTAVPEFPLLESGSSIAIENNQALRNIGGFPSLVSSGRVSVVNHPNLEVLGEFQSLETLTELSISNNGALAAIPGFSNLRQVGIPAGPGVSIPQGGLTISAQPTLQSIGGFPALQWVGGLWLRANDGVVKMPDFPVLESVGRGFDISFHANLAELPGFPTLTAVGEGIQIRGNPLVREIAGLTALQHLGGSIQIRDNDRLENLDGLSNVTSTITGLSIHANQSLTSIWGLQNLGSEEGAYPAVEGDFTVTNNTSLPTGEIEELAELLGVGGTTTISGNLLTANVDSSQLPSLHDNSGIQRSSLRGVVDRYQTPFSESRRVRTASLPGRPGPGGR